MNTIVACDTLSTYFKRLQIHLSTVKQLLLDKHYGNLTRQYFKATQVLLYFKLGVHIHTLGH